MYWCVIHNVPQILQDVVFPCQSTSSFLITRQIVVTYAMVLEFRSSYGYAAALGPLKEVPWIPPQLPPAIMLPPLIYGLYTSRRIIEFRRIFIMMSTWQPSLVTRALGLLTFRSMGLKQYKRAGEGRKRLLPSALPFNVFQLSHCRR
jgi:hypothetical protein